MNSITRSTLKNSIAPMQPANDSENPSREFAALEKRGQCLGIWQ